MLSYPKCLELKQAGFPQGGELAYIYQRNHNISKPYIPGIFFAESIEEDEEKVIMPSFEELWVALPRYITFQNNQYSKELHVASIGYWNLNEEEDPETIYNKYIENNNILEATANLYLLLKKNKVI